MKKVTFLLSFLFLFLHLNTFAQTYSFEKWFNGKKSATVLTFDDWSPGQGPIGVAGLNAKGLVGSFYITINNVSDWQPIKNAAAAGHEIGNHTRSHPHLSQITPTQLVDEVTTARTYLESQLPGVKVQTLVYPHGDYNNAVIAETQKGHFSARAYIEPMVPNQQFPYNFATTEKDYYTLNTVPVDVNMTPTIFGNWIQQGINTNGLLTFTFHSLSNANVNDTWWDPISETQYLSLLDKAITYQSQTWITTYANAVKYHKEVNSAVLANVSNNADFWVLSLTDTIKNNQIFNHPLTINLQTVVGETYSSISQNGVNIPFTIVSGNLVFNAIPDGGNISINKSGVSVVLNSPTSGTTFMGLNPISLSATPTVIGATVTNVTYNINGQTIVVSASPYTASWTPTAYGSYTVTATVNASNGKTASASAVIAVNQQPSCADPAWNAVTAYSGGTKVSYNNRKYTANWWNQNTRPDQNSGSGMPWTDNGACGSGGNTSPVVSLTAPTVLTYTAPASVSIAANASDADGTISKVEFYNETTLLNSDVTSPYAYSWTGVTAGTYVITAKAYDNASAVTTSTSVTITVNAGNTAPTVSLTAPTVLTYTAPATVSIAANAADANGTISKVDFYNGTTLLNSDATSPYTYSWTGVAAGTYVITAKAYDNASAVTTSSSVTITVNAAGNVSPTVSLTAPTVLTYTAPATVSIAANAGDVDGTISKVEFYNGTTLLNSDAISPYAYSWTGVAAGTYVITAKAYDNASAITTSSSVTITVNAAGNVSPTVNLTAPTVLTYTAPATVSIAANAADADGTISKVDFYNGTTLLNSDATSPYAYSWTNVAAGTYVITAKAYDNASAVTTSSSVTITVNPAGGTCTAPQYVAGTTYATGASVQNNGHKYTCTVGGWCSSTAAWAYAPGTGSAWTSAWTDLGNCTSRVGVAEVEAVKTRIYPNPSKGVFVIEVNENVTATIFNTVGTEVASLLLEKGLNDVNLTLTSGIYMIRINNEISKLVIE